MILDDESLTFLLWRWVLSLSSRREALKLFTIIADLEACRKMRPQIEPGDILKVETGTPITEKDILIISLDKIPVIGSVKLVSCGAWVSFSNPAYVAEFIPMEELNRLHIMGRITERIRRYK